MSHSALKILDMNEKQSSPNDSPSLVGHSTRLKSASNTFNSEIAKGDLSIVERHESTPNAFTPGDPTQMNPIGWRGVCLGLRWRC